MTKKKLSIEETAALEALQGVDVPDQIRNNMALFLRLVRKVLEEADQDLRAIFDVLLFDAISMNDETDESPAEHEAFEDMASIITELDEKNTTLLMRAFVTFFHLANICEENYRVKSLRKRESEVSVSADEDPINDITVAYHKLVDECGRGKANALLNRLEFHPVFTAHPTEARRKAVEGKIRRIAGLLEAHEGLGGVAALENERRLLQEFDALFRTSPIAHKKPTPSRRPTPSSTSSTTRCSRWCPRSTVASTTGSSATRPASCRPCAPRSSTPAAGSAATETATRT